MVEECLKRMRSAARPNNQTGVPRTDLCLILMDMASVSGSVHECDHVLRGTVSSQLSQLVVETERRRRIARMRPVAILRIRPISIIILRFSNQDPHTKNISAMRYRASGFALETPFWSRPTASLSCLLIGAWPRGCPSTGSSCVGTLATKAISKAFWR